ncbi:MAG: hypothetical protein KC491_16675, partial [Dehalococcoidia bacterium]|nr:hypothetical protein [Dehalococcoidia bacterium]
VPESLAAEVGLERGDRVLKIAGSEVTSLSALPRILEEIPGGKPFDIVVERKGEDGEIRTLTFQGQYDDAPAESESAGTSEAGAQADSGG